jgi:hypothetical protein
MIAWKVSAGMQDLWKVKRCNEHSKAAGTVGCFSSVFSVYFGCST